MPEENKSQEFRLKNVDEIRNYFIEEIDQNGLMITKYKKVCGVWSYTKHLLILVSAVTGCVMCFHFFFCFFSWYSCRYHKF